MKLDWQRTEEVFLAAIERSPETRTAFVQSACASDSALLAEVTSMLRAHVGAEEFLETPAIGLEAAAFALEQNQFDAGEQVGNYEIVSLLGEGGMGEVYLAKDTELGREVALKFIKRGAGACDLVRHFRHEARILAALNNPHIARLYGGAVTADGTPYFAMEYVEGEPLTDYCEQRNLGTKERLELFGKVCAAVSYAHQHLVIHRDLKPANIRVTAEGEPKLLDFGIARVLETDTSKVGEHTISLAAAMTPEYASPEQVLSEPMTTASDVYSLGVVLYELLTGAKPFRLAGRSVEEARRVIIGEQPERPSTLATDYGQSKLLRGDLDNIILTALRKEPERRYPSVARLADDLRRHLDGLPVTARRDTLRYRGGKFLRRNRVGAGAAALLALTLLGGIAATLWQAAAARKAEARARSVNAFLEQMIGYSNPYLSPAKGSGQASTMAEMLDAAAKRIEGPDFADHPEVKAELERIIAASYSGQGQQRAANAHLQTYVDLETRLVSSRSPKMLSLRALGARLLFSRGELAKSEAAYRAVLPQMEAEQRKGAVPTEDLFDAFNTMAYLRRTQGDSKEAESYFRRSLALVPQLPKTDLPFVCVSRSTLASTLADEGRFDEALQTARAAVAEERERQRTDTPAFGFSLTVLGGFLTDNADYAAADSVLHEGEAIFRKLLGPSHLWLGDNLRNQAISSYQQQRYDEALAKVNEALAIYRESFGPTYDQYPTALLTRGLILSRTDHHEEGEQCLREALSIRTASLPVDHFWVALAKGALGEGLTTQSRFAEAEPLLQESYNSLAARLGINDPRTKAAARRLKDNHR